MIPTKSNRLSINCPHCGELHGVVYGPSLENEDGTVKTQMKRMKMNKKQLKLHEAKRCFDNKCDKCGKDLVKE